MIHDLRTLTFQELAVFSTIVQAGSLTSAGEQLGLAKSAISTQLARLESRLGIKLLVRSSRRLQLTPEGERVLTQVISLLAEGQQLLDSAKDKHRQPSGLVRIAATPDFGAHVLTRLVPVLTKRYPDIKLVMKMAFSFEDLQDPQFDLALRIGQVKDERLVARKLGELVRVMVGPVDLPARQQPQHLTDVAKLPALVFSNESTDRVWSLLDPRGELHSVRVNALTAVQSFPTLLEMVAQGTGVTVAPTLLTNPAIAEGKVQRLLPGWQSSPMPIHLVYRQGAQNVQRIAVVKDLIEELAEELTASN